MKKHLLAFLLLPSMLSSCTLQEDATAYLLDLLILGFFGGLAYLWMRRAAKRSDSN